jgi:hypothetical protein
MQKGCNVHQNGCKTGQSWIQKRCHVHKNGYKIDQTMIQTSSTWMEKKRCNVHQNAYNIDQHGCKRDASNIDQN